MKLKYRIYKMFRYIDSKDKESRQINFIIRTFVYITVSVIVLSALSVIGLFIHLDLMAEKYLSDFNVFDLLLGQISNTLIVLSLTSVLSENFGQIYWMDIKEEKLVYPFWQCFTGMTVYLLTGLVFSIISYAASFYVGTIVSFLISTLLLVVLTFKMISIYFGKEKIKIQLNFQYKRKYFLTKIKMSDYFAFCSGENDYFLRKLTKLEKDCKMNNFPSKWIYMFMLKMEIKEVMESDGKQVDSEFGNLHVLKPEKIKEFDEQIKKYDKRIEEYTRKAIMKNDRDVILENIELLVECENCETFLHLFEELFDWDEGYACRTLAEMEFYLWKNSNDVNFLKQHIFHKLILCSGNFDALQKLLRNYDSQYQGMRVVRDEIEKINKKMIPVFARLKNEKNISEEERKMLEEQGQKLKMEFRDALSEQGPYAMGPCEMRSFHVPIKETYIAYMEGKYEEANKMISAIILNFKEDLESILKNSGIMQIEDEMSFVFSYVTHDEMFYIDQIIEKDETISVISKKAKDILVSMKEVRMENHYNDRVEDEYGYSYPYDCFAWRHIWFDDLRF